MANYPALRFSAWLQSRMVFTHTQSSGHHTLTKMPTESLGIHVVAF